MRWPLVDTHHADGPRGTDDVDQPVQDELRVLLAGRVVGLVAHGLHAAVDAVAVGRVHDLLDRVALREVDRCRAVRLGQLETVGTLSTTNTWEAPSRKARCAAISPTGPAPYTATRSPMPTSTSTAPWKPVGKMSESIVKSVSCSVPCGRCSRLKSA